MLYPIEKTMRNLLTCSLFVLLRISAFGQCSDVSISVSSSDTNFVQLYHAGLFLIDSGYANICEWEVNTFDGTVIHQDTTIGLFEEQSFSLFNHTVPISDSMVVNLYITNPVSGIACSITDTLFWDETEILPGSFVGNWAVIGQYGGTESELVSTLEPSRPNRRFEIHPTLFSDQFRISTSSDQYILTVVDASGRVIFSYETSNTSEPINTSYWPKGIYFVSGQSSSGVFLGSSKVLKISY
jgi:hypothetical protein